ncbi:neurexin-1 isoform X1 [Schistocerca americana]|uniref:neurexin-1 isoform X1 n=1 Tax=Schistocerca americana TaxID=7009 RepID=UPI001F4FEDAB|nr:neurexin-1 isoform X1 [Schistocerca americana]XP_049961332.1 neurexin-1 isoform X1 [Schistocerca serialis cubense]
MRRALAAWCVAAALWAAARAFVLEGSQTSYAQFRKWNAGLNGTLELEFKTDQPNGLLLYTDDGGTYDFFEIKLVEGALRLRYNLGGGAQILTVGRDLNDGHWHKVAVRRSGELTSLTVDGATQARASRGSDFRFGSLESNSDVFIGGMPAWYSSKLTLLALPSVIFEPRFGGAVRNLVYADEEATAPRRQEMKMKDFKCGGFHCAGAPGRSARGIRGNLTDACEDHDPCQHGGICISTDSGPICECRNVDFEGIFCEKDKAPSEATFRGAEFLSYDLSRTGGEPIVSNQDAISLVFKTRQPSGLLFYTGDKGDFMNVALKDGGVVLAMSLGNGRTELAIKPRRVRFDDNQWHKLTVHRKMQEISSGTSFCRVTAVVDGVYAENAYLAVTNTMLSSSRVYVGGSYNTHALPGSKVRYNFVGCLRKVEFTADTLKLNLIDLGRRDSKLIAVVGHVDFMCQEVEAADPVTFTTSDSNLVLPSLESSRSSSISFKIRTNEPNGLILYSSGASAPHADYLAFELLSGHLYLHLDLGSGAARVKATTRRVDDGAWHEATLKRSGLEGRVTVDGTASDFTTPGESQQLDLEGPLYVGGLGPATAAVPVPAALWTGALRRGFVGCLRDLVLNGNAVDVAGYARHQDSGAIRPSCHAQEAQCSSQPCLHGGACSEGWNRFICDCSATSFTGPTCGKEATTLTFNGSQLVTLTAAGEEWRWQTEEVSLRFQTARPLGLLLATAADNSHDRLELSLMAGRLRLALRVADREKVVVAGQGLNDNQWHTVRYSRRATSLKLQVDDDAPIRAEAAPGRGAVLEVRAVHVGAVAAASPLAAAEEAAAGGGGGGGGPAGFVGAMQQLSVNGRPYFEVARAAGGAVAAPGSHSPRIRVTAAFGKRDPQLVHNPVTFRSKHTFVGLPVLKAYSATNIYFQLKTREANGLILYNGGRGHDFVAVELVSGHLHYVFNLGDGAVRVRDNARAPLNDNHWHAVTIGRPSARQHTLMVDDSFAIVTSLGTNENLDLAGILYLGGVRKDMYGSLPKQVTSKQGFQGCLASLDLNGESPSLLLDAVVPSTQVALGCEGSSKCSHNVCANRGVCVQQWNFYACDCDMTSYTGPTCSDESVAFEWGPDRGLLTFQYPEGHRPEMKSDVLALGFITGQEDAVLLRVDSGTSNDYMELEIVEGNIFMVYNMGTNDHPIGEIGVKVNDNQYHVVRFTRSGANSTIQVDDYNIQTNHPAGHQLTVFNSQSKVQVGGKWNNYTKRIERPFSGVMAGIVFNGLRILDLAAEGDVRTTLRGDVRQLTGGLHERMRENPLLQRMQQTPASGHPGVMDDLVFSGAGSGCNADDEDECEQVFDHGSGDDLITPVYVPPTRPPTTVTPKSQQNGRGLATGKPCDDEDCFTGSGSGEVSTEDNTSTSHAAKGPALETETDMETATSESAPAWTEPSSTLEDTFGSSAGAANAAGVGSYTSSHMPDGSPPGPVTQFTTTTTELPPPPPPPPPREPPIPSPRPPPGRNKTRVRISSEAAENTALVIGIIAGAMIAIILLILIILKFKNRADGSYKVDESKNYRAQPVQGGGSGGVSGSGVAMGTGLLGCNGQPQLQQGLLHHPQQVQHPTLQHMNGSIKNGTGLDKVAPGKPTKKQNVKDVKEWYV